MHTWKLNCFPVFPYCCYYFKKNLGKIRTTSTRVSVQGVKSLGGHFACLCREFDFHEVKNISLLFFKKERKILLHFLITKISTNEDILRKISFCLNSKSMSKLN